MADGDGSQAGSGGTIVKMPPSAAAAPAAPDATGGRASVSANIEKRRARMDERRRELLAEARNARVEWIHGCADGGDDNVDDDGDDIFDATSADGASLLGELRACAPDALPCAPRIIESMLSSSCDWIGPRERTAGASSQNGMLRMALERQGLSWESVSKKPSLGEGGGGGSSPNVAREEEEARDPSLKLAPIPLPHYYAAFLNALSEPAAADVVMSIQKFCKTIRDAKVVMLSTMKEDSKGASASGSKGAPGGGGGDAPVANPAPSREYVDHGASLAKAVRGFMKTTMREIEGHEAFRSFLHPQHQPEGKDDTDKPTVDEAARDQLQMSLEKFVYSKCRRDVDMVLSAAQENVGQHEGKQQTLKELEAELHDKMLSLQFVTPAHLEIHCLKAKHADGHEDIDLSYTIGQLQSIHSQSSPRQMLKTILLAHRGVSVALNDACDRGDPPGADDILPTLILATLRAHPPHLLSSLRFIESFAPMPLLRGEAGYAYTNLCGAMQFIRELDVDGHLAEVTLLGGAGEREAVLSIGPEEFRLGLEECREKMKQKAEEKERRLRDEDAGGTKESVQGTAEGNDAINDECTDAPETLQISISARDVRDARTRGENVDLEWAVQKQHEQQASISSPLDNRATPTVRDSHGQLNIPSEEPPLPSNFSRSYSFLTAGPDNIGLRDLPKLLAEYKMLVHATEKLLNERSAWRESERKRQLKLEREHLERGFVDVIGVAEDAAGVGLANGH